MFRLYFSAAVVGLAVGCTPSATPPDNVAIDMGEIRTTLSGKCFANDVTPAVIQTVTLQEIDTPEERAADGTILRPATFRTVTRQNIVQERQVIEVETICPPAYTPDFVATLQRALTVRGYYQGPINGILDTATTSAVRRYQGRNGDEINVLTIQTARDLGLVALDRDAL